MSIERDWFEEIQPQTKVFTDSTGWFIIHKGFKIKRTEEKDIFTIQDVRFRDVYSELAPRDKELLEKFGFIRGVDLIAYKRDLTRRVLYNRRVEKLYSVKLGLKKSDPKYSSKLRNCIENINKTKDLMFDYQVRINQFKIKYNGKDKEIEDQARVIEGF